MSRACLAATLLLVFAPCIGIAAEPQPASPAWFVPPPPRPGGLGIDMRRHQDIPEIVVTAAPRAIQRNPHGEETHDYEPFRNEASGPDPGVKAGISSYCQSAYDTVGGQPGTGHDIINTGRCN